MSFATTESKSSQIAKYGYDIASKVMEVKFRSGGTYHYHDVPHGVFERFHNAESHGKHLHAHIKGAFQCSRLKDDA